MNDSPTRNFNGYVIYSRSQKPIAIVSHNEDRRAICSNQKIPSAAKKYLIAIEDKRFYQHGAIDMRAVIRACYKNIKAGSIVEGGSTLTQQLARNILKDCRRTIMRKVKESILAISLETKCSKEEILDRYFNTVFWGDKLFGLRAASLQYFEKEPNQLRKIELLALIVYLRGPNFYLRNPNRLLNRVNFYKKYLERQGLKINGEVSPDDITKRSVTIGVIRNAAVPYLAKEINIKRHSIQTSIDGALQDQISKYVDNSAYPVSCICLNLKGDAIGFGSTFGSDYPFEYKSNVGSTLKPFIYGIIRSTGILQSQLFSTQSQLPEWQVRENVPPMAAYLTLGDALIVSNNNVFINAAVTVGIDKVLKDLSGIINKPNASLTPATILGAVPHGLSLFELASSYNKFFQRNSNKYADECRMLMTQIAHHKFQTNLSGAFLKTGTTNLNRERFAVVGYAKALFGFLRQGNEVDDFSKEGNFLEGILNFLSQIGSKVYKW